MTTVPAGPPEPATPAEAFDAWYASVYDRDSTDETQFDRGEMWEAFCAGAALGAAAERAACIEQIRGLRTHPTWQTDRWAYQAVIDLLAAPPGNTP